MNKALYGEVTEADLNDISINNQTLSINSQDLQPYQPGTSIMPKFRKFTDGSQRRKIWIIQRFFMAKEFLTEQFEYENLPDGMDKYDIENLLLTNGKLFFVRVGSNFYIVNASVEATNYLNHPTQIRINCPDYNLDNIIVSAENFVEVKNNMNSTAIFIRIIGYLEAMEVVQNQIRLQAKLSTPKVLFPQDIEPMKNAMVNAMDDIIQSDEVFHSLITKSRGTAQQTLAAKEFIDQQFARFDFESQIVSLKEMWDYWDQQLRETLGASTNHSINKKERMITDEVNNQQDFADRYKLHALNMRKRGFDDVNKKFGLNVKVTAQLTDSEKQQMNQESEVVQDE